MNDFKLESPLPEAGGQSESEHYPTPSLLAQRGVEIAVELFGYKPRKVVEPGCSERAPFATAAKRMHVINPFGIELRDIEGDDLIQSGVNYLNNSDARDWSFGADIIITNPPFSLAVEFVMQALEDVAVHGLVVMLLQTGIEGSKERRPFWDEFPPVLRYVIRPRPGFIKGGSDSREYAYYFWKHPTITKQLRAMGRMWTETRFLDNDGPWGRAQ